ncbi:hypothetical protein RclHR1_32560001 [Rhizophagus clarus]|uniref:Uncharacterized protein n=1 Tax=Rhizophagus clarus TaxID=94130 RepID=A0A2Z6RN38_9GLOM|nr:hypothetical protein RclHR1_32560001 [Rhizophagus clarus]
MIIFFMELFFKDITRPFWKLHSSLMHAWEKARNITRKKKIKYRKKNKKGNSAPTSDNPTSQLRTLRRTIQQVDNSSSSHIHGFNATTPQKSIPRNPFKFDRKLFIYLNSSNYLHSGDCAYFNFYGSF